MIWKTLGFLGLLAVAAPAQDDKDKQCTEDEAKEAIKAFKTALSKCKEDSDFVSAINDLAGKQHPKILEELKPWLTKHPNSEVKLTAAEAVSKYRKNKAAAEALLNASGPQKDKTVAAKMVQYAAETECREIAAKLTALFKHKDTEVARAAVEGCGKIKSKVCIDPLIKLVMELEAIDENQGGAGQPPMPGPGGGGQAQDDERIKRKRELLSPALGSLRDITEEKWVKGKEWLQWWNKNKATFKEPEG
jgi:HEAT repeat protein